MSPVKCKLGVGNEKLDRRMEGGKMEVGHWRMEIGSEGGESNKW